MRARLRRHVSRALLALVALVGLVSTGYGCYLARRQAAAVAAVRSLGGRAIYADELPHATLVWPLTWINSLLGHDYAARVVAVQLSKTPLRNGELACLAGFDRLQALWLNNTSVNDEGLSALRKCRYLRELSLRDTPIGDAGLKNVTHLSNLQFLYLHDTNVGDSSLPEIEALKNLKVLCIPGTKISREGVQRLRAALPNTSIRY